LVGVGSTPIHLVEIPFEISDEKAPQVFAGLTVDLCLYSGTGECAIVNRFRMTGFNYLSSS